MLFLICLIFLKDKISIFADNFNKKVSESITPDILKFQGIRATEKIAESQNAKVIVIGAGEDGLPIILGGQ